MKEWISFLTDNAVVAIDTMAVLIIIAGTIGPGLTRWLPALRPLADGGSHVPARQRHHHLGPRAELGRHRAPRRDRVHPHVPQFLHRARHQGGGQVSDGRRTRRAAAGRLSIAALDPAIQAAPAAKNADRGPWMAGTGGSERTPLVDSIKRFEPSVSARTP